MSGFGPRGNLWTAGRLTLRCAMFQQAKHIHWDFEQNAKSWWYPYGPRKGSKAN